jgi:hypothetical protein
MATKKRSGNGHGFTYRSYSFKDKEPVIFEVEDLMKKEGLSVRDLHFLSHVSDTTYRNMFYGETRRPRHATIEASIRAMGYKRIIVRDSESGLTSKTAYEREVNKGRAEWKKKHEEA